MNLLHPACRNKTNRNEPLKQITTHPSFRLILLSLLMILGVENVWGATDPILLFHETFGNNTGNVRDWKDDYSEKYGVENVYTGASYTVTNFRQCKNTMGNDTISSALISTANNKGTFIVGPLNVQQYNTLYLTYDLGATKSWHESSYSHVYYSTDGTNYTEVSYDIAGPTAGVSNNKNYKSQSCALPSQANSATLYLKIEAYHYQTDKNKDSIGQVYIDNVALSGIKNITSIAVKTAPTKVTYSVGDNFDPTGLVITATYADETTEVISYAGNEGIFTFNPSLSAALQTTNNSVTITYGEKTTTQSITVNKKESSIIIANMELGVGEKLAISAETTPAEAELTYSIIKGDGYITLNGNEISGVATGIAVVNAHFGGNNEYATADKSFNVTVRSISTLFYESFDTNNGTGGNDNKWSGSIASSDIKSDNTDWTFASAKGASKCAKFGTGSDKGSATTPAINFTGNAKITFKAGAWDGTNEKTTLKISATNGTLSQSSVTLTKGAWTTYTVNIKEVTTSTKITFEASQASDNRFFLDSVIVENYAPRFREVTIASGGLTTLYLDYATKIPDGAKAYYISTYDSGKDQLTATPFETNVPANTGIIVKGTAGSSYTFNETGETVSAVVDNKLKGRVVSYDEQEFTTGDGWYYLSTSGTFKKYEGTATKKAYKAYLYLTEREWKSGETAIKSMSMVFEDATDIQTLSEVSSDESGGGTYNLSGQQVGGDYKGIVIRNGKKYLKK